MAVLVIGFLIIAIWPILRTYDAYDLLLQRAGGSASGADVERHYLEQLAANRQIVEHIRQHGRPDDSFLVFGFWTQPYIWEERPLPSRFVTSASVRSTWSPAKWRRELIADLIVNKPRFIAVAAGDHQPWLTGSGHASDQYLCDAWPELRQHIEENYRAVINNGLFVLYAREARENLALPRCVA
jgi:hypothetical protein